MSRLTQILAGTVFVLFAVSAVLLGRVKSLDRQLTTEQAKVVVLDHTLVATRHSLNVYMARARATAALADTKKKELTRALESHPDWRDTPVPDAVFDSLYKDRGAKGTAARDAAGALP